MNSTSLTFEIFDDPLQPALNAVDAGLGRHNDESAPLGDVRPLAAFARRQTGEVMGGAVGRTWGACCELQQLWVDPAHRGQGIASRLLIEFEGRATSRGCRVFYLTTFSFQAPDFYRKHGYSVSAETSGFPDGIVKYFMHKEAATAR